MISTCVFLPREMLRGKFLSSPPERIRLEPGAPAAGGLLATRGLAEPPAAVPVSEPKNTPDLDLHRCGAAGPPCGVPPPGWPLGKEPGRGILFIHARGGGGGGGLGRGPVYLSGIRCAASHGRRRDRRQFHGWFQAAGRTVFLQPPSRLDGPAVNCRRSFRVWGVPERAAQR